MPEKFCRNDLASRSCPYGTRCYFLHLSQVMSPRLASTIRALRKGNERACSRLIKTVHKMRHHLLQCKNVQSDSDTRAYIGIQHVELVVPGITTVHRQPYFVSLQADGESEIIVCERSTGKVYAQSQFRWYDCEQVGRCKLGYCHQQQVAGYVLAAEKVTLRCGKTIHLAFDVLSADFSAVSSLPWTQDDRFESIECYRNKTSSFQSIVHTYRKGCFEKVRPVQLRNSHRLLQHLVSESGIPNLVVKPIYPAAMATKVWSLRQAVPYPVDGLIFTPSKRDGSPTYNWKPSNKHTIDVALGGGVGVPGGLVEFIPHVKNWIASQEEEYEEDPVSYAIDNVVHHFHVQMTVRENGRNLLLKTVEETQEAQTESTNLLFPKVLVPEEQSSWAEHRVVKVHFNLATKQLEFVRIRFDKKEADSLKIASATLASQQQNSSPEVAAKLLSSKTPEPRSGLTSKSISQPSIHSAIKNLLHSWYAGESLIDACCGNLQDLDGWERVGVKRVLAIDINPESVQCAKQKLQTRSKRTSKTQVTLYLADLSVPASLPATEQVDTVVCHFAIHHFWTSEATKNVFIQNLLPHLRPGGHFVVTYMNADALQAKRVVGSNKDPVDFDAIPSTNNGSETNTLAKSIGVNQAESLVYHEDLVTTMKGNGLSLEADMSFAELRSVIDPEYSLSAEGVRFGNLYRAAVFQTPKREVRYISVDVLFHRPLFFQVLSFLDDVKSIVRLRRVHSWFRRAIRPRHTVQPSQELYILIHWMRWNPVLWHAFFDSAGRRRTTMGTTNLGTTNMSTITRRTTILWTETIGYVSSPLSLGFILATGSLVLSLLPYLNL